MIQNEHSVYNQASIYNQGGGEKFLNAGKSYVIMASGLAIVTPQSIKAERAGNQNINNVHFGVCPNYTNDLSIDTMSIDDVVEINAVEKIHYVQTGWHFGIMRSGLYNTQNTTRYYFGAHGYSSKAVFYAWGGERGGQFDFIFDREFIANIKFKKIDTDKLHLTCKYNNSLKFDSDITINSAILTESILPAFGSVGEPNQGLGYHSELLPGSYVKINDNVLFGEE